MFHPLPVHVSSLKSSLSIAGVPGMPTAISFGQERF